MAFHSQLKIMFDWVRKKKLDDAQSKFQNKPPQFFPEIMKNLFQATCSGSWIKKIKKSATRETDRAVYTEMTRNAEYITEKSVTVPAKTMWNLVPIRFSELFSPSRFIFRTAELHFKSRLAEVCSASGPIKFVKYVSAFRADWVLNTSQIFFWNKSKSVRLLNSD